MTTAAAEAPPGLDDLETAAARDAYAALIAHVKDTSLLGGSASVLSWDQETLMPPGGAAFRAAQLAQLSRLVHERATDPRVDEWLSACEADPAITAKPTAVASVNVRELRRGFDKATKLPTALVEALSRASSAGRQAWKQARAEANFAGFADSLTEIIRLSREKAAAYGWAEGGEPWDALADNFEPGCTAAEVSGVFTPLRERLVALIEKLQGASQKPKNAFASVGLPVDGQERFVREIAASLGFDFERGRLDVSTHPFCGGSHRDDVRMTTRFGEANFPNEALGSTMHECGHGLYEQGLGREHIGTPMGSAVSLGIHESQSRMWENQVGRSRAFWSWCAPKIKAHFGAPLADFSVDDFYGGANIVAPSFIRVEADEATYNLHVMIRFELERALLAGDLEVAELPAAWNQRYKEYLGVDVPDDAKGCLQDIHWSMNLIGYFPTYTLGNLYCAQFFDAARRELGDLDAMFAAGEFAPLLGWLREKIHVHGRRYRASELVQEVTGAPLSADPLMAHLEGKLLPLYGLA